MSRPRSLWSLLNLPCREMAQLASESLDRDLGRLETLALRSHLLYCRGCRRYLRQLLFLRRAVRRLATRITSASPPDGSGLPDDVRDRIKQALDQG